MSYRRSKSVRHALARVWSPKLEYLLCYSLIYLTLNTLFLLFKHQTINIRCMTIKTIESNHAPAPVSPYSPASQVDNLLFISGQIPLTSTGDLVAGDFEAETRQVLTNIGALLKDAGLILPTW